MWLEGLLAFAFGLPISLGICLPMVAPIETKRFMRWVRVEVGALFKGKPRHLSIEMAMHLDAEVDMKWWEEEFAKLDKASVSDDWVALSKPKTDDHLPLMSAEWGRWVDGQTAVINGDFTYSFGSPGADESVRYAVEQAKFVREYCEGRAPKSTDDYDLSVDLAEHAQALSYALSLGMVTADEARAALEDSPVGCEFCEYDEIYTYTRATPIKRLRNPCWECDLKMS